MLKTIFSCLLAGVVSSAVAEETISVFQLDGSVHCATSEITAPQQAADTLKKAGVAVVSAQSRMVPFALPGDCGTPTGKANLLVVNAADWKRLIGKVPGAHGFAVWVFDRPVVEVYKYDGSLQCQRGKETALEVMARELTAKGIEVKASRKGSDGLMHIAMCGASTGRLNVYSIDRAALPQAQALGFRLLITRQMSNEIKSPAPLRRGTA